jgi:hypothetical protein
MDPLTLIILAVVFYFLYQSGFLSQFGIGQPPVSNLAQGAGASIVNQTATTQVAATPVTAAASPVVSTQAIATSGAEIQTATVASTKVASAVASSLGASTSIASAIPVVGAAVAAIASILIAASEKRAAEAKNENSAVAAAVPGWDTAITQIATAFNNGTISYLGAQQLFAQALKNYWSEVTPQIQSGRNGCNGGNSCPGVPNPSSDQNTGTTASSSYCSGNIGAACCVGCADLNLSTDNLNWAVAQAAKTGVQQNAFVQVVFASKYGGVNRPSYNVFFDPTGATTLPAKPPVVTPVPLPAKPVVPIATPVKTVLVAR